MRHLKSINHLGRKSAHRKAMLANMASSLIMNKRIATTEAKAKALRTYIEPLITKSKEDSTHNRRTVFSYLKNKIAVAELFREVSPAIAERPGGYTRILKTGNRLGDNADMCIIELVDFNENMLEATTADSKSKSGRRRRGSKKKGQSETADIQAEKVTDVTDHSVKDKPEDEPAEASAEVIDKTAVAEKSETVSSETETEIAAEDNAEAENQESDNKPEENSTEEETEKDK